MTATRDVPTTSRITSLIRSKEWFSRPFVALTNTIRSLSRGSIR